MIHQRPSILVRNPYEVDSNAARRESRLFLSYPDKGPKFDSPRSWVRYILAISCELYVYWKLLSHVPFDLLWANFAADLSSTLEDTPTFSASGPSRPTEDEIEGPSNLGKIDLHPTLPLLAVASSTSLEVLFYCTETSKYLWNYQFAPDDITEASMASKGSILTSDTIFPYVTCLRFSEGSRLAVGLSNGTVHFMEQNLSGMMKTVPKPGDQCVTPIAHSIKLLPIKDPSLYTKSVGPTTNLVFSPGLEDQEDGVWLAIATERSGIWMWNQRSRQALRAVRTGGIGAHCLHWISIEEKSTLRPKAGEPIVHKEKCLGQSQMEKWRNAFGDAEDITALDGCFSSPLRKSISDHKSIRGSNISECSSSLPTSARPTLPSTAQSQKGNSLLICGTLDGRIWIQNLWNSEMMMQIEKSTEIHLSDVIEAEGATESVYGTVIGPITNLLVHALEYASKVVKIPITVACDDDDGTSVVHTFDLSLPLSPDEATQVAVPLANTEEPSTNRLRGVCDWLSPSKRRARWLKGLHISRYNAQPIWLMADSFVKKATLMSASSLSNANLILTTLRPSKDIACGSSSSQGVLFTHNPRSTSVVVLHHLAQIRPLVPTPAGFARQQEKSGQKATNKGYYTNMLVRAGIDSPITRVSSLEEDNNDGSVRICDHVIKCGQVAWGKGRYGRDLGAFLYKPGSLLDEGLGIALFELEV